jgi:folate-binding protein YgfZ
MNKFPDCLCGNNSFRRFTSSKDEFNSLKNGVGLRINNTRVLIQMTGQDVLDFLHRISTNKLKDLKNLEKRDTIFLNEKGRFIDRTTLVSLDNEFLLIGSANEKNCLLSWINKFIITEDIQTKDVSGKYLLLEFIGPQSESFISLLIGKENHISDQSNVRRFDVDGFTFRLFMNTESNNIKVFKLLIDRERCSDFIEHLYSIKSVFDFDLIGDDAFNAFRVENGIPAFPNEINPETNPHEVNLIDDVCFTKGCYIGQEVIARLDSYDKVQRKLYRVAPVEDAEVHGSTPVFDSENNEVGRFTTCPDPELLPSFAGLALIRRKTVEGGSSVFIESQNRMIGLKLSGVNHTK